ncbi:hypothetical protein EC957_001995 [Mortierella hygrophila]|uniref:Uncharacterized protein n=1 Tax=Mortierella hygrophila TaxID=979708 RepID=A0A9P6FF73_9FUNG|nr:hypothetical protein EC957_001995 [Mortierella hygrophila]
MEKWKKEINSRRAGAGYFLAQPKRLKFDPLEYIENRAIKNSKVAQKLRREWEAWMRDLSSSKNATVSEVAKTARPMKAADLDKYYKNETNQEFEAMVETLDRRYFWTLQCSGRCVEDVLIEAARNIGAGQHEIHSLIIYMSDPFTRNLFTSEEWSEISNTNCDPLPELPNSLMNYLETFNKNHIEDLHRAADAKLPINGNYQHEIHWALRWIRIAVETWLGLYCQRPEPLKSKQKESFYRNDVFGIINSLLRDVQDLVVVHGELTSDDTAARRNDDRTLPIDGILERKKMGPRCDGLVQIQGEPPLNIAVLEAAKEFDTTGSKFLFDTQKVIRTLHDMLRNRLAGLHVRTRRHELTLVGYIVSGPSLMTLYANCPGGYVVRFNPHLRHFKLADDISQFKLNLRILKHLLVTKQLLQTTKGIIHETPSNWDVDGGDDSGDDGGDYDEPHEVDEEVRSSQHVPTTTTRKVQLPKLQTSPGRVTRIRSKSTVHNR